MILKKSTYFGIVSVAALAVAGADLATTEGAEPAPTFNRDVAPLVFRHCTPCHRPGEVAPFSMLGYRDLSKRTALIRTVIEERSMPPWKAEPGPEHFADERRLSDQEIDLITRWIEAGAPEGDPADLPEAPRFTPGWRLGEPDLVVSMGEPYALAAEGPDEYRCFVVPLQVPEGKYLRAVEYRPGNPKIVHHAVLTSLPERAANARLDRGDGKSFSSGLAPPGMILPGPLGFWTPGMDPRPLPDGYAAAWKPGDVLVLQLHLHPSGKPETEQSSLGLYFTDQEPKDRLRLVILNQDAINIPPGSSEHVVTKSLTLPSEVKLYGVFPHMHLIGRSMSLVAQLPDGTSRPLIAINDWDFQWQFYYRYASPVLLPAGTRLEGRWTFDNSEDNPANPSHPPKRVTFGEQTTNEMAIAIMDVLPVRPVNNDK